MQLTQSTQNYAKNNIRFLIFRKIQVFVDLITSKSTYRHEKFLVRNFLVEILLQIHIFVIKFLTFVFDSVQKLIGSQRKAQPRFEIAVNKSSGIV